MPIFAAAVIALEVERNPQEEYPYMAKGKRRRGSCVCLRKVMAEWWDCPGATAGCWHSEAPAAPPDLAGADLESPVLSEVGSGEVEGVWG